MTFEEFLIKKKIDSAQLKNAEQAFFDEFRSHFEQMGEKSFDHSKKFWFNKLRRAYPLEEVVKIPVTEVLVPQAEALGTVAEALEAPSKNHEKPVEVLNSLNDALKAKPAFKPRFKAKISTSTAEVKPESKEPSSTTVENHSGTESPETQAELIKPKAEGLEAKPAFKPRFKASMLKKDPKSD